jgi:hypothetical protein
MTTNIATAVTVAPRVDGAVYLHQTLRSLRFGGFQDPILFSEPGSPVAPGYEDRRSPKRLWSWPNFLRAVSGLIEAFPAANAYAVFQDDVLVAEGLADYLEHSAPIHPWDSDTGIVSPFTSEFIVKEQAPADGWFNLDEKVLAKHFYGAYTVIMTAHAALTLIDHPPPLAGLTMTDLRLGWFCAQQRLRLVHHCPSLAEHIGEQTALPREDSEGRPMNPTLTRARTAGSWCRNVADLTPQAVLNGPLGRSQAALDGLPDRITPE